MSETWFIFKTTLGKGLPKTELMYRADSYGEALNSLHPNISEGKFKWTWSASGRHVTNVQEGVIYTISRENEGGNPEDNTDESRKSLQKNKLNDIFPPNSSEKVKEKLHPSYVRPSSHSMEEGHTAR